MAQMSLIISLADVPNEARGLNIGLKLHIYFVYASSEGSGKSKHMHKFAMAFVAG